MSHKKRLEPKPWRFGKRGPLSIEERVINTKHPRLDAAILESAELAAEGCVVEEKGVVHSDEYMLEYARKWDEGRERCER